MQVINVSAAHVARGKVGDCAKCPVALAFADAGYRDVAVCEDRVYALDPEGKRVRGRLTETARAWIKGYDRLRQSPPFSFFVAWEADGA